MARQRRLGTGLSRRGFLRGCAFAYGAVLVGTGVGGCAPKTTGLGEAQGPGGRAEPRLRLALADAPELGSVGGVRRVLHGSFDFYLIRKPGDEIVAIANVCSHERCATEYKPGANVLSCPCHGSQFDLDGVPVRGPATKRLRRYHTTLMDGVVEVTFNV